MTFLERFAPVRAPDGPSGGGGAPAASSDAGGAASVTSSPPASSPSGASSTPSPSPGATVAPGTEPRPGAEGPSAPAPSVDAPAGEALDFSSIFGDGGGSQDAGSDGVVPAEAKPKEPTPPAAVVPPEVPAPVPVQPTVVPPAASPQDTTSQTDARSSALDPADPLALARELGANEAAAIEHVANSVFKLSREEIEALESDVVGTVPKLFAKAFVKSQVAMLTQLGTMVPQMIGRQVEALRANAMNENKFFSRWPMLKEQGPLVRRLAATYRQMNPTAKLDAMIEELGPIVMMAAKLPMQAPVAAASPMAPVPTNGVRPPSPSPFVPAVGGPGAGPQSGADLSPVEALFLHQE